MAILVLALGALMSICGIASIFYGSGILTDKDWVSVLGGVAALNGGLVVFALGLMLRTLLDMRDALRLNVATGHVSAETVIGLPAGTVLAGETAGPSGRHEGVDFDPGRDVALSRDASASLETRHGPSLMTPELESGMLAAILSSREEHAAENHPVPLETVMANTHPGEESQAHRHEADADHAPPADRRAFPFPDPHGDHSEPVETPRFGVSFKGQWAGESPHEAPPNGQAPQPGPPHVEPAHAEPTHAEPTHAEPAHAGAAHAGAAYAEPPWPESPQAEPLHPVHDQDGPAMDDWLDRAFSALDEEIPPLKSHRSNGTEPDRQAAHHDHDLAQADLAPAAGVAEPYPEPAPPKDAAVIGRYEADGTLYVMFADGSIEAQSAAGIFRFASMAELKAHIESVT